MGYSVGAGDKIKICVTCCQHKGITEDMCKDKCVQDTGKDYATLFAKCHNPIHEQHSFVGHCNYKFKNDKNMKSTCQAAMCNMCCVNIPVMSEGTQMDFETETLQSCWAGCSQIFLQPYLKTIYLKEVANVEVAKKIL